MSDRVAIPEVDVGWNLLFDTLAAEYEVIGERVCKAMQAQLPSYRGLSRAALDAEVALHVEQVLKSARAGRATATCGELAELAAVGEERARQGVPVDEMLRAWRIGVGVLVNYAREVGQRLGVDANHVLEFVQSTLAWSDVAMVTTAAAHRKAELARTFAEEEQRVAFLRGALAGSIPVAELRVQAEANGLDPAGKYVAVRARLGDDAPAHKLEQLLGLHLAGQRRRGLSAAIDGGLAGLLSEPPPVDIDGVLGFGPAMPLERLSESYRLASRALMTAQSCGLRGAYDISSLGLRTAVVMDKDIGESLRHRYIEPLEEGGSACELMATLRAYLTCGLHVERAATRLFVHQNTVRYRLARFEELTGRSLRDTEALFEVWWALEFSAMRL